MAKPMKTSLFQKSDHESDPSSAEDLLVGDLFLPRDVEYMMETAQVEDMGPPFLMGPECSSLTCVEYSPHRLYRLAF